MAGSVRYTVRPGPDGGAVSQADLPNELLFGSAAWLSGLDIQVSDWAARIDGVIYTGSAEVVTLATADGSNPRLDVIVVESDGTAGVVTGTPAANPVEPEVDPTTQVKVALVQVNAGASTPANITNTDVYLENTEWTTADSGATVDPADTSDPNNGSKNILFDAAGNGDYLTLTDSSTHSATEFNSLIFAIKNTVANTTNRNRLRIALYNGTTRVSSWIELRHGTYSFNGADTANYQNIIIPITDFQLGGNLFDTVRWEVSASGPSTLSFVADDVKFQTGITVTDTGDLAYLSVHNDWQKAQGTGIVTLTDAASIVWDMSRSNVYQVTLGGDRAFAAPTNVKPGYTYLLHVIQDGTGGHTPTWDSVFKWAGGEAPVLSAAAGAKDLISFTADASGNLVGILAVTDYQ